LFFQKKKIAFGTKKGTTSTTNGLHDLWRTKNHPNLDPFLHQKLIVFIMFRKSCSVRHFFEDLLGLKCYENFETIPNMFGGAPSLSKTPTKTESVFTLYFTFSSNWPK
jgi:hypothetical protein